MKTQSTLALFAAMSVSLASPMPALVNRQVATVTVSGSSTTSYPEPASAVSGYPIHASCNGTERHQLEKAFGDTIKLAQAATQHIYDHGNTSSLYTKYFGEAPTAEVIGWYEKVVHGNREGILFRCDDIDGNCHQDGWGGHWRGENATMETVICPLSYSTRQPLEALCGFGYTVAAGKLNYYFASDLLHRLYHVTSMGEGAVEHYADSYEECLALAQEDPAMAVRNSHTLQYFALDVYAFDVALPGEGCTGRTISSTGSLAVSTSASSSQSMSSTNVSTATASSSASVTASSTTSETTSDTASAAAECHTHAGGEVHCV